MLQRSLLMTALWVVVGSANVQAVDIETVAVGNAGNVGEGSGDRPDNHRICGAVAYTYRIGTYEVTARQYCAFLNATAKTDTYGLYNPYMADTTPNNVGYGCSIQRSGSSGSYTYSVADDWANRPVNYVSWGDSARFANWLHNGQPTGTQGLATTEDGAYFLNGATNDADLLAVNRKSNWKWAITSEDEWYKAAYHKNDGVTGNYWHYPTSSDDINTGMANYNLSVGQTTDVGSYVYPSPYGTFDQGGNLWEWNEAVVFDSDRGLRGGAFGDFGYGDYPLNAWNRGYSYPTHEGSGYGFRVVEAPEPATLSLLMTGMLVASRRR